MFKIGDVIPRPVPRFTHQEVIDKVEKSKSAKFVFETSIRDQFGNWVGPVAIYWQETPPVEGYSHYFAFYRKPTGGWFIASGESATEQFDGIVVNGVFHHSAHRHDYNDVGPVAIDGGRDYARLVGNMSSVQQWITVKPVRDTLQVVDVRNDWAR